MEPTYYTCTDQRCEQSEAEQRFLARIASQGVPIVPQVKLGQNWVFDGAINGTRLLVEYHGAYWHTRPEVQERDARKQAWAEAEGYQILTIWEQDAQRDLDGAVQAVVAAYHDARQWSAAADAEGDKGNTPTAIAGQVYGDWRDRFLAVLSETGIVREACIAAGISRKTAYQHQRVDGDFAAAWKLALQDAADAALAIYRRRAIQQSDRAMEFFIKSRDPESHGQLGQIDLVLQYLDVSRLSNEQFDRLAAGESPLSVLLGR